MNYAAPIRICRTGNKQALPGGPLVQFNYVDGVCTSREVEPTIRHELRPTGDILPRTGEPETRVWSIDVFAGHETQWREAKISA